MADMGVDMDGLLDIALNPTLATGARNLGNALGRRLITDRGSLSYDADYGFSVRGLLNASYTDAFKAWAQSQIASECEKDERVLHCDATLAFSAPYVLTVTLVVTPNDTGGPFTFVMSVNNLTTTFLQAA
jgi:hypothetical protein